MIFSKPLIGHKKALLIGIEYEANEENGSLEGPHKGVAALRKMLIEQYGYADKDIVVMLDNRRVKSILWPTYANILRQIDVMVAGAKAGDRFFFAYSGHSGQVPNRHNSEEDGQDETIISSDGKDLLDNILKARLVDPLPVGSSLVAILDTCHSGTLLDLAHHQCNRIFTPRISKGYRKTDFRWNANVRRDAMNNSMEPSAFYKLSRPLPTRQRQIVTTDRLRLNTNHDGMNFSKTKSGMRTASPSSRFCNRIPTESHSLPLNINCTTTMSSVIYPMVRCESPTAMWACDGNCRSKYTPTEAVAHVVCISACKDEQRAWEGPTGASIIMEVIQILKKNPQPSLKDLMVQLTHRTHERCLEIHECTRQWKRESHPESFQGEMDNFQDPQLASHIPLNMDELFAL